MTDAVAILIVNYNMPERADALAEAIEKRVKWPHATILIDNGSDICSPAKHTTLKISKNVQTTGGWLAGLEYAQNLYNFTAYWFLITSAEFLEGDDDPLAPMMELMLNHKNTVGIHSALSKDSTTSWQHLIMRGCRGPRRTWMIDNISSLWRADWFDAHPFDPELKYGWGIDLEACYLARKEKRDLWVHERSVVKKVTDIGYAMNRMNMAAEERRELAGRNMRDVLSKRYGPDWWQMMTQEYVTDELR